MTESYYIILGITPEASADEIKRAYRRKVIELHPDHYGPDTGPFLEVQEAYATLSDPVRRQAYDTRITPRAYPRSARGTRTQRPAVRARPPTSFGPVKRPIGSGEFSVTESFEGFTPSFEEVFDRLWANFTGEPRPKSETPETLTVDVPVSMESALSGGSVRIMVPAEMACPACGGRGGVGFFECWECGGHGRAAGESPVTVSFPPGIVHGYSVAVPLTQLGIQNLYLTVRFYVVR